MKHINKLFSITCLFLVLFFMGSCDDGDDFTNHSQLDPVTTSVTIKELPTETISLIEEEKSYTYEIELSNTQITDIVLYVSQTGGDAVEGEDFSFDHSITIPAGATKGAFTVSIHSDDLIEEVETFSLQIGDERTANAVVTPGVINFEISNFTSAGLTTDMSWTTNASDVFGFDISDTDAADLMLVIIDAAEDTVIAVADGAAFESYGGWAGLPDGEYLIASDFYASANAGDFNGPVAVDIILEFNQPGVINAQRLILPGAMNTATAPCYQQTVLAQVIKTGETYEINEYSVNWADAVDVSTLAGTWTGIDAEVYESQVTTSVSGDVLKITGLGFGWMEDFWGEEILESQEVEITFDPANGGGIIIPEQTYMTTLYDGAEYGYTIVGTGVVDICAEKPTLTVNFTMLQDGFDTAGWANANGYLSTPTFVADIVIE